MAMASDFYLRYYVGHKGKFGHEFLEFGFRPDGERWRGGREDEPPRVWVSVFFLFSSLFQLTCFVLRPVGQADH